MSPRPMIVQEIQSLDQIYNLRYIDLWQYIVDNPLKVVAGRAQERIETARIKTKKFYRHGSGWAKFMECDERYAR